MISWHLFIKSVCWHTRIMYMFYIGSCIKKYKFSECGQLMWKSEQQYNIIQCTATLQNFYLFYMKWQFVLRCFFCCVFDDDNNDEVFLCRCFEANYSLLSSLIFVVNTRRSCCILFYEFRVCSRFFFFFVFENIC